MNFSVFILVVSTSQLPNVSACSLARRCNLPADEIGPRLPNGVLEGARNRESRAHTQTEAQNAAVQLPQAVLEPVPAAQLLDSGAARGHLGLVREEAIEDQRVYANDHGGREDDVDAEPGDGDTLLDGEGVVEGVVVQREVLVERRDLIDEREDAYEHAGGLSESRSGRWSCARRATLDTGALTR
jgi:hypothetical protein